MKQQGMTLIELMIVVVIVSILAAIAYPSYRQQIMRSNRTEAKGALEQTAQALESCFTRSMVYNTCAAGTQFASGGSFDTPNGVYRVIGTVAATTYTLTATARAGQLNDTNCRTFVIDESGRRTSTNSAAAATTNCWR